MTIQPDPPKPRRTRQTEAQLARAIAAAAAHGRVLAETLIEHGKVRLIFKDAATGDTGNPSPLDRMPGQKDQRTPGQW